MKFFLPKITPSRKFTTRTHTSAAGIRIYPKTTYPVRLKECESFKNSLIIQELHTGWDMGRFKLARAPLPLEPVADYASFNAGSLQIVEMPIKLAGSNEYRIPQALYPFGNTIRQVIDTEHTLLSAEELLAYNAYITIDQSYVKKGTHPRGSAQVAGLQGAKITPKGIITHSYIASNASPTVFFPQPFDLTMLNPSFHNIFHTMDAQAIQQSALRMRPNVLHLMNAYCVHATEMVAENSFSTLFRISYHTFDAKKYTKLGDTQNPLFHSQWEMVPRKTPLGLINYQALSAESQQALHPANWAQLPLYLQTLQKKEANTFYNVCYEGILLQDESLGKIIINQLLALQNPEITALRLLFLAAGQSNFCIARWGARGLITELQRARGHIVPESLLNLLLEMLRQRKDIFPKELVALLIQEQEMTCQGKEIIHYMNTMKASMSTTYVMNCSSLWKKGSLLHDKNALPNANLLESPLLESPTYEGCSR